MTTEVSVTILLLARALLGGAESFIITGAVTWGLALLGQESAGRVIAWMGMAMFAAFALGAPIGTSLYGIGGFFAVALATTGLVDGDFSARNLDNLRAQPAAVVKRDKAAWAEQTLEPTIAHQECPRIVLVGHVYTEAIRDRAARTQRQ